MAVIANLGFALQAADISTRAVLGLRQNYLYRYTKHSSRTSEYLDTLEAYEYAIENIHSGGGALAVDENHPLQTYVTKMTAITTSIRNMCNPDDIETQGNHDQDLAAILADEDVWSSFLQMKAEVSRLETGLQQFITSNLIRYMNVCPPCLRSQAIVDAPNSQVWYPNDDTIQASSRLHRIRHHLGSDISSSSTAVITSGNAERSSNHVQGVLQLGNSERPRPQDLGVLRHFENYPLSPTRRRRCYSSALGAGYGSVKCPCDCHSNLAVTWPIFIFNFTSTSYSCMRCSQPCKRRGLDVNISIRLRISYSRISFAILSSLGISLSTNGIHISPYLGAKRFVSPDSIGFVIVKKFRNGQISFLETALALNQAFATGEASRTDSTWGSCLVQEIMFAGLLDHNQPADECLKLLGMVGLCANAVDTLTFNTYFTLGFLEDEDNDFLNAVREADLGYEICDSVLRQLLVYRWPFPSPEQIVDPFELYKFRKWMATFPGFGDVPAGIERILGRQTHGPYGLMCFPAVSVDEVWLGLNALFWAVLDPSAVHSLLIQGHDPNSRDREGRTPVFYAAAYGQMDCILLLLKAGAHPDIRDTQSRNFLIYALENNHVHVVVNCLQHLLCKLSCSDESYKALLHESMFFACRKIETEDSFALILDLFRLGADPNAICGTGENLCHILSLTEHAQIIFNHGFSLINMNGPGGCTPFYLAAKSFKVRLLAFFANRGSRLEAVNNSGQNALHAAFPAPIFRSSHIWHSWYSTIRILLQRGVGLSTGDHCRCACSKAGCPPAQNMYNVRGDSDGVFSARILPIEYLMLLEELVGSLPAQETLAEVVRYFLFDEFELTHVCCQVYRAIHKDDISEILDEEKMLIDDFEKEVDATLEKSVGSSIAEFWEEVLFDLVKRRLETENAKCEGEASACKELACLECWQRDLFKYNEFVHDIYRTRFEDEITSSIDPIWLFRRERMVQRCLEKVQLLSSLLGDSKMQHTPSRFRLGTIYINKKRRKEPCWRS